MLRVRIHLFKAVHYRYLDIIHDALVNAFVTAGASGEQVTGMNALTWNFAALGRKDKRQSIVHTLVVSTPDPLLADILHKLSPAHITYARANTVEAISFTDAQITAEEDPLFPQQKTLGVLMLSPLVISRKETENGKKRWHQHLAQFDLTDAVNSRLSRLAKREICLQVRADSLYMRCNPEHSVLVPTKRMKNGKLAFVIGMNAPLVLQGDTEDLRFAWHAGLGEKTRSGFGCIGLVDQGIGR